MRIFIIFSSMFLIANSIIGQSKHNNNYFLDTTSTSLKGKIGTTIITNHTTDTLKLESKIIYNLPVSEKAFKLIIPPEESQTLKAGFNYPDFIQFTSSSLQIFNAPGKVVRCEIESVNPIKVTFKGDLYLENNYYQDYHKYAISNNTYYKIGAQLKDFNQFPKLADSLNQINLNYLEKHGTSLPPNFKKQEYWRLMYNNAFMKYHVLFDKEFKSGDKINIKTSYYDFNKNIPLSNPDMILSTEYLWYTLFNLRHEALIRNKDEKELVQNMIIITDSLYKNNGLGDVLKMRLLYDQYQQSKTEFQLLSAKTNFINPTNKTILDSVIIEKFQLPLIGGKAPGFKLININSDTVLLKTFTGHPVIINFWATWCNPCIKEFPFENNLYKKYKDEGLIVINICVDSKLEDWKQVSIRNNLQIINLYANGVNYEYFKKYYNLYDLPRSVFIGKDMKIINNNYKRASLVNAADIENLN